MATLHVRNVPDVLYERLQARARSERRSLSAEVIQLIDRALAVNEPSPEELLSELRRRRRFMPAAVGAPDSTALLREDRDR